MLAAHEKERIDLAQLGEGMSLPLTGPIAAVAAVDEYSHELGLVDRRLLTGVVDVVELGVHMPDLGHDVAPFPR